MSKQCEWCQSKVSECDACPNCGSSDFKAATLSLRPQGKHWSNPFFYNGYVVWELADYGWCMDTCTWHFYLGDKLVEVIKLSRDVIEKFVEPGMSAMSFIWDLFTVAQGEKEVLRVQEQNKEHPVKFEIRRIKTEYEEWVQSLTYGEVVDAIREGQREL